MTEIEGITGEQAASAIERFAEWVAAMPGVWSVTVENVQFGKVEMDLHLIVHADLSILTDEEAKKLKELKELPL